MSFTHLCVEHNYHYKEMLGVTSMGGEQNFGEQSGRLSASECGHKCKRYMLVVRSLGQSTFVIAFSLLDKNVSYHTSASDCVNVCVCTHVLCTVYTETLNAPLSKVSRQGHYILHLATSHCVENG